jgi:hypothetical protein
MEYITKKGWYWISDLSIWKWYIRLWQQQSNNNNQKFGFLFEYWNLNLRANSRLRKWNIPILLFQVDKKITSHTHTPKKKKRSGNKKGWMVVVVVVWSIVCLPATPYRISGAFTESRQIVRLWHIYIKKKLFSFFLFPSAVDDDGQQPDQISFSRLFIRFWWPSHRETRDIL